MKIVNITAFTTPEGYGRETSISLDGRRGLYYQVATEFYKSEPFKLNQGSVPVVMHHMDREDSNVTLNVDDIAHLYQGYQLSKSGIVLTLANDDWADSNEVVSAFIKSSSIRYCKTFDNRAFEVNAIYSGNRITLRTKSKYGGSVAIYAVVTNDSKTYYCPITLSKPTSDYNEYLSVTLPFVLEVHKDYGF